MPEIALRPPHPPAGTRGRPWLVGHRGAMGYAPENTLPSFELALAQGADILECDVHLSRDGHLIVIHDSTLDRTTGGTGRVRDLTLAELKRLDASKEHGEGFRGTRLPSLDELLDWSRTRAPLAVELKQPDPPYPDYERRLVETLHRHKLRDWVVVISFDHPLLGRVRALDPRVRTGIIYGDEAPPDPVAACRAVGADAIHPRADLVTADLVAAAHAAGYAVSPWVLDDEPTMRTVLATGVDSAATNYPDRLRAVIDNLFPG